MFEKNMTRKNNKPYPQYTDICSACLQRKVTNFPEFLRSENCLAADEKGESIRKKYEA